MPAPAASPPAVARVPRALAFRHDALAIALDGDALTVALPAPYDPLALDDLRAATRLRIEPVAAPRERIREGLREAYGEPRSEHAETAPAVRTVDRILADAIAAHASDVHVEPDGRGGARVRLRIDGILRDAESIPPALVAPTVSRIKVLAGMDVADRRAPQDGRWSVAAERGTIDARAASVPAADGEKVVVRLLDRNAARPDLARLGMPAALLARYAEAAAAPWGFVVVSGPTGSGKTTTLYASLARVDCAARNVCSVEDPVELRLDGVTQVQINARAGLTFPVVLRAFMRQDPNVIMIGEMRDAETAGVAVAAALAGQTVFTTLHANDAPRTIDRLVELGVSRHSLAAALSAVVAQRLVRRLCEHCRAAEAVPDAVRRTLPSLDAQWWVPRGCRACGGSGYAGRTGVYELLAVDDGVRDAIASGLSSVAVARLAAACGYRPMRGDALAKVAAGVTSFAELRRVVGGAPA